jgi:hypothetical protein
VDFQLSSVEFYTTNGTQRLDKLQCYGKRGEMPPNPRYSREFGPRSLALGVKFQGCTRLRSSRIQHSPPTQCFKQPHCSLFIGTNSEISRGNPINFMELQTGITMINDPLGDGVILVPSSKTSSSQPPAKIFTMDQEICLMNHHVGTCLNPNLPFSSATIGWLCMTGLQWPALRPRVRLSNFYSVCFRLSCTILLLVFSYLIEFDFPAIFLVMSDTSLVLVNPRVSGSVTELCVTIDGRPPVPHWL